MFPAALFTTALNQGELILMSIKGQMDKMWYSHMKSPITKDDILFYSIYIQCSEQANPERKYVNGYLGLGKSGKWVWVLTIKMLYGPGDGCLNPWIY